MDMFQVFTPAQAKTATEERVSKDALRARNIALSAQELLKEKSEIEKEFEETMLRQRLESEAWFEMNTTRKNELKSDVERLEIRRKEALMPPLIKEEDIHSVSEALHARKLRLDLQEQENESTSRLLMQKLDEVSTQKQILDEREERVHLMESGAETQRNQVAANARKLNLQMQDFMMHAQEKEQSFALRDSELDAQEHLIKEKEKGFVARERELGAAMRLLADQQLLLKKGFEELNKKEKLYIKQ